MAQTLASSFILTATVIIVGDEGGQRCLIFGVNVFGGYWGVPRGGVVRILTRDVRVSVPIFYVTRLLTAFLYDLGNTGLTHVCFFLLFFFAANSNSKSDEFCKSVFDPWPSTIVSRSQRDGKQAARPRCSHTDSYYTVPRFRETIELIEEITKMFDDS